MLGGRPWDQWLTQYARSHQHPVNRACHLIGIPLIVLSLVVAVVALFLPALWVVAAAAFVTGWVLQFAGHAVERKAPEFFHDWRFLFVGVRWWLAKVRGRT